MTYTVAVALGVLAAAGLDLAILGTRLLLRRVFWVTYAVVFGFQLVFNGTLSARGVLAYDDEAILGLRLVRAPVEDLAFGFALVLTTLALWVWLETRDAAGAGRRPSRPLKP